jgi:PucR C-terminal helix-turn-helix domain/GGDEF-like domain
MLSPQSQAEQDDGYCGGVLASAQIAEVLGTRLVAMMPQLMGRVGQADDGLPLRASELAEPLDGVVVASQQLLGMPALSSMSPVESSSALDALARRWARQGGDLISLLHSVRTAQESVWREFEHLAERTIRDAEERWALARSARNHIESWNRAWNDQLCGAFDDEQTKMRRQDQRHEERFREMAGILAGETVPAGRYDYDFSASHLAVIAWGADASERLTAMARSNHRRLLSVQCPDQQFWGWLGGHNPLDEAAIIALLEWQCNQQGGAAFGEPAHGIEGFRTSHVQAVTAREVALEYGDTAVRFDAVALLALAGRDPDRSAGFVEAELGPLVAAGPNSTELLQTLQAYLEHGQRVGDAATVRGIHRNTATGHLNKIRDLLAPRRIDERSAELLFALRLHQLQNKPVA